MFGIQIRLIRYIREKKKNNIMVTQTDVRIDRRADGRIDVGKLSIEVVLSIKICFRLQPLKIF